MSECRQRTAMVSIRLLGTELAAIQRRATERGMTLSAHIRDLALNPPPTLAPGEIRFWSNCPFITFSGSVPRDGRSNDCPDAAAALRSLGLVTT